MKETGYMLLFLSASGGGIYAAFLLEKRKKQLMDLRKSILFLKREIDFLLTPLKDSFFLAAERAEEPWKTFFLEMADKMEQYRLTGEDFYREWENQIGKIRKKHPWEQDLSVLRMIGRGAGQPEKEMQLAQFSMAEEELLELIHEAEAECRKKSRVYRMLGISSGILLVLIFL